MFLLLLLIITLRVVNVQADLTCLGWGLISPIVGLFCHFSAPETFHAAENHTVAAVEEAVQDAKSLVHFDLTHNPIAITYNFLDQTSHGGFGQGRAYLANVTRDFGDVTIGFGKESANQVVQIFELAFWDDVSFCLIKGAGRLTTQARRRLGKRAGVVSASDAVSMAQSCVSDKLKKIANPAVFHINGTNQRIGSTISDVAALLVPVGVEEVSVAEAAEAVDLAIPGSEGTTRIVKMVGDSNAADHFANEAEAEAVAENMKDASWVDKNCGVCGVSPPPISETFSKMRRGISYRLDRRVNILTCCCRAPTTVSGPDLEALSLLDTASNPHLDSSDLFELEIEEIADSNAPEPDLEDYQDINEADFADSFNVPVYDPTSYQQITDADLVRAPKYERRDTSVAADVDQLNNDLDTLGTGVVAWSPELRELTTSKALFDTLHTVFRGPKTSRLYQLLHIQEDLDKLRMATHSSSWLSAAEPALIDPALKPLQAFVNKAIAEGIDVFAKLQGLDEAQKGVLQGDVEFFYTSRWTKEARASDTRGFHTHGTLQFEIADTPGLIIKSPAARGAASRVPVVNDAFQLMKGPFWDFDAYMKGAPQGPTWWTAFGEKMAHRGRTVIRMHISPPVLE